MKKKFVSTFLFLLFSAINCTTYQLKDLRNIFRHELCLEGKLDSFYLEKKDKTKEDVKVESILNLTFVRTVDESEKPALSRLNELAHYHQLDYYFNLEKEEGPDHQKSFTLSLTLGKEKYIGQGTSLKKAKQDAATKALGKTEYELPKVTKKTTKDIEKLTPTVLLNNIGSKLGVDIIYYLLDKDKEEILHSNIILTEKNKSYLQKLNDSLYDEKNLRMKREIDVTKGPFRIKLKFGDHIFYSTSHSIQSGRHDVASKALDFLTKNKDNLDFPCLREGSEEECKRSKDKLKSPVSKVYEEAQKRKLNIEFEVIKESGLSHKRLFVTECILGDIKTVGEGMSKKESKRIAAINMLEKIKEMDPVSLEEEYKTEKKQKRKKNKKNRIIKTRMDEISMALENVGKSLTGLAKNFFGDDENENKNTRDDIEESIKSRKQSIPTEKKDLRSDSNKKSSHDELLELSNVLNFKVAFTDSSEDGSHISLLSLYTNPEYTCFGEDKTEFAARNVASKNGLELLGKMGIYDLFLEHRDNALERETKEEIRVILDHTVSKNKEEL